MIYFCTVRLFFEVFDPEVALMGLMGEFSENMQPHVSLSIVNGGAKMNDELRSIGNYIPFCKISIKDY